MNTSTKTLFVTALIAAIGLIGAAGLVVGQADKAALPQQIVKLERVVIVGKRADTTQLAQRIEQLPRVVIEGRRADAATVVASAKVCQAQTLC